MVWGTGYESNYHGLGAGSGGAADIRMRSSDRYHSSRPHHRLLVERPSALSNPTSTDPWVSVSRGGTGRWIHCQCAIHSHDPHMSCSVLPTPGGSHRSHRLRQCMIAGREKSELGVKWPGWVAARHTTHGSLTTSRQLHSSTAWGHGAGPACRMVAGGYVRNSGCVRVACW